MHDIIVLKNQKCHVIMSKNSNYVTQLRETLFHKLICRCFVNMEKKFDDKVLNSDKRLLSKLMNRINDNDLEDIISSPCAFNIASYKHVVNL